MTARQFVERLAASGTHLSAKDGKLKINALAGMVTPELKAELAARKLGLLALLSSVEDWQAIQETLYLLSVPGMRESIKKGMAEPLAKSAKELNW